MDNYGRIRANEAENSWLKDDYGRLWTIGSALHNRRVQVRFLSHLPRRHEFLQAAHLTAAAYVCVL
jgi:hypothetical protein